MRGNNQSTIFEQKTKIPFYYIIVDTKKINIKGFNASQNKNLLQGENNPDIQLGIFLDKFLKFEH